MRKRTHLKVATWLCDEYSIGGKAKAGFLFGSVYMDCIYSVFVYGHKYTEKWLSQCEAWSVAGGWFRRGCILHLWCDFFTLPHNAEMGKIAHLRHEGKLSKEFSRNGITVIGGIPDLATLHERYLTEIGGIQTDWRYICQVVGLFGQTYCSSLEVANGKSCCGTG